MADWSKFLNSAKEQDDADCAKFRDFMEESKDKIEAMIKRHAALTPLQRYDYACRKLRRCLEILGDDEYTRIAEIAVAIIGLEIVRREPVILMKWKDADEESCWP